MKRVLVSSMTIAWLTLALGCGSDDNQKSKNAAGETMGSVAVQVQAPAEGQVSATIAIQNLFDPANVYVADCMEKPYPLPGDGAFCDSLIVLPPGVYEVIVQSEDPNCRSEQEWYKIVVQPNQTTEIPIQLVCGADNGAADIIVTNDEYQPVITDIDFTFADGTIANKFVCQSLTNDVAVTVTVVDQDTDCANLTVGFVATLNGVDVTSDLLPLAPTDPTCYFSTLIDASAAVGDYQVTFWVTDPEGNSTSITFPVHIIECPDTCCQ